MSMTPFRDTARKIAKTKDYVTMSVECDRARSHSWWKNLVEYGAWEGYQGRVAPPDLEAVPGIAKLFDTTEDAVKEMIAVDWYGVHSAAAATSARVLRAAPLLDELSDSDADLVDALMRRLRHARPKRAKLALGTSRTSPAPFRN